MSQSREVELRLWVKRVDTAAVRVRVTLRSDATASDLATALCESLAPDNYAEGSHSLRTSAGLSLPPDARISDCQLLHGQVLELRRGGPDAPLLHPLSSSDSLRLIHQVGPRRGEAIGLPEFERLLLTTDGSVQLASDDERTNAAVEIASSTSAGLPVVSVRPKSSLIRVLIDDQLVESSVGQANVGSTIRISASTDNATDTALRVLRADDHERVRNQHGVIQLTVSPSANAAGKDQRHQAIRLSERPSTKEPKLDWAEIGLQDGAILVLAVGMLFAFGSFGLWRLAFLILPVARFLYRLRQHQVRLDEFHESHNAWKAEINADIGVVRGMAADEAEVINTRNPGYEELRSIAINRSRDLWARDSNEPAYGKFTVGKGAHQADIEVAIPGRLTSAERSEIASFVQQMQKVDQTDIEHDLTQHNLAIASYSQSLLEAATNNVLIRLATQQSPLNIHIAACMPDDEGIAAPYSWVAALPHARASSSLAPQDRIRFGKERCDSLLKSIISAPRQGASNNILLIVVHDSAQVDEALLAIALSRTDAIIRLLWLTSGSFVPTAIDRELTVHSGAESTYGGQPAPLRASLISPADTVIISSALECLVDSTGIAVSSGVPGTVSLRSVTAGYQNLSSIDSLEVTLGETAAGPYRLDLVDSGPHILVGGTTGSGKSQFLRSLALGLAASYSPAEMALFLVDYKGGAAFRSLRDLPHAIGFVTNLGEEDVDRAVSFLTAELRRRQELLAPFDGEYKRYRQEDNAVLPRLVVIIDEFGGFSVGASKDRQRAVLDLAARGRAQGVHMVLATQSPRTAITDDVRANVNARVGFRTLDGRESSAILGDEICASIPRDLKGRCFVRTDGTDLVQVQSGYSESVSIYGADEQVCMATVELFDGSARTSSVTDRNAIRDDEQLAANLREAFPVEWAAWHKVRIAQPKLDAALSEIPNSKMLVLSLGTPGTICLGVADLPRSQKQVAQTYDLTRGSLLITGSPQSGRTSALCVAAQSASEGEPSTYLVAVDGSGSGEFKRKLDTLLGEGWGWMASGESQADLDLLLRQVGARGEHSPVVLLIDRLDSLLRTVREGRSILADLVGRGIPNGLCLVSTSNDRSPEIDEMKYLFRYRASLDADGSQMFTDGDGARCRVSRLGTAGRPNLNSAKPNQRLGRLKASEVASVLDEARAQLPSAMHLLVDEVTSRSMPIPIDSSFGIIGASSRTTRHALDALGVERMRVTGRPTPLLDARPGEPPLEVWIDVNQHLEGPVQASRASGLHAHDANTLINVIRDVCHDRVLAVAGLDHLSYFIERLGFVWTSTANHLARFLVAENYQILASGPVTLLQGRSSEQNGITDRLRRTEANFIMLDPPNEDSIAADLHLYRGNAAVYAGRPGRRYGVMEGYAMIDGVRTEGSMDFENVIGRARA